jgi:hypothetical protein
MRSRIQVIEHGLQRAYHERGNAAFQQPGVLWRAVMGTDGTFDAAWTDRADGDPEVRFPQRAAITWHAYVPDPACDPRPVPTLAVPGGVRRAETGH